MSVQSLREALRLGDYETAHQVLATLGPVQSLAQVPVCHDWARYTAPSHAAWQDQMAMLDALLNQGARADVVTHGDLGGAWLSVATETALDVVFQAQRFPTHQNDYHSDIGAMMAALMAAGADPLQRTQRTADGPIDCVLEQVVKVSIGSTWMLEQVLRECTPALLSSPLKQPLLLANGEVAPKSKGYTLLHATVAEVVLPPTQWGPTLEALLRYGADPQRRDNHHHTPWDIVQQQRVIPEAEAVFQAWHSRQALAQELTDTLDAAVSASRPRL